MQVFFNFKKGKLKSYKSEAYIDFPVRNVVVYGDVSIQFFNDGLIKSKVF